MVTQKYAIKSHLTSLLSSRNHQLVFTVKTVKIQLDDLVARLPCLQACYGHISPCGTSKVTMAIALDCGIIQYIAYIVTLFHRNNHIA